MVYAIGATFSWIGLTFIGYEIELGSVLLPSKWGDIRVAQERIYARRAQEELAIGNYSAAILSLEMVRKINPRNQKAGLALAKLLQVSGRGPISDRIYEQLIAEFPEDHAALGQLWFRTLLARGDFTQIKRVVPQMLEDDLAQSAAWMHALLFASRMTADPAALKMLLLDNKSLPEWCVRLASIEISLQSGEGGGLVELERVQREPGPAYVPRYQVERLLAAGRIQESLSVLNAYDGILPHDEAGFLRLRIYTLLGWDSLAELQKDNLVSYPMRPQLAAQFCAHLIRHPDKLLMSRYWGRLSDSGLINAPDSYPVLAATYLAAVRCGDADLVETIAAALRNVSDTDSRVLQMLGDALARDTGYRQIGAFLPSIPIPIEVGYALHEVYSAQPR